LVRELVGLGRAAREKERLKVRQPLQTIMVDGKYESLIGDLTGLIKEELNVKAVVFEKHLDRYMNFKLKPHFKTAGPALGSGIKSFGAALASADAMQTVADLEEKGEVVLQLDGEDRIISRDLIEVSISAKEGFVVSMENNLFTILDTTITPELLSEGLARELVSKVQQMRKQKDFQMLDNIHIIINADEAVLQAVTEHRAYIMKETLAVDIIKTGDELDKFDLNGHKTGIDAQRIGGVTSSR
jgi:isoleucyl-tRNA synthetase